MNAVVHREDGVILVAAQGYYDLSFSGRMYCGYYVDEDFKKLLPVDMTITSLSAERFWMLYLWAKQCLALDGCFIECGVAKGGSAKFLAGAMQGSGKLLHLFDTFCGMPKTDPDWDVHRAGEFSDTSVNEVREYVGHSDYVRIHEGFIPDTLTDIETPIAFAHVDVDIKQSMKDCCEFIYPRLTQGGVMVIDDYGQATCPGARKAVDDYFVGKRSVPISLLTNQAIVVKI